MKMASLFQSVRLGRSALVLTLALVIAPAVPIVLAQELLPELAAPAAKHKAADEALDKQKLEAIALAAKSYVSALDSIEKAATAKGEIDLVAAVVKEREAVASGALEPSLPEALPKTKLQMSRKSLLASVERINVNFAKRKKAADADYLRELAALQTKAATNTELAKQLADEKSALLGGGGAVSENGKKASKKANSKNAVVNGDFENVVDGMPKDWEPIPSNTIGVKVETENKNNFVRLETKAILNDGKAEYVSVTQKLDVPKQATSITASVKLRTNWTVPPKRENLPALLIKFEDKDGQCFCGVYCAASLNGKNGSWKKLQSVGNIPKDWVNAVLVLKNSNCPGQVDFDDVEVTFK